MFKSFKKIFFTITFFISSYSFASSKAIALCLDFYASGATSTQIVPYRSNQTPEKKFHEARIHVLSALRSSKGDQTDVLVDLWRKMTRESREAAGALITNNSEVISRASELIKENDIDTMVKTIENIEKKLTVSDGLVGKLFGSRQREIRKSVDLGEASFRNIRKQRQNIDDYFGTLLATKRSIETQITNLHKDVDFLERLSDWILSIENIETADSIEIHILVSQIRGQLDIIASQIRVLTDQNGFIVKAINVINQKSEQVDRVTNVEWPNLIARLRSENLLSSAPLALPTSDRTEIVNAIVTKGKTRELSDKVVDYNIVAKLNRVSEASHTGGIQEMITLLGDVPNFPPQRLGNAFTGQELLKLHENSLKRLEWMKDGTEAQTNSYDPKFREHIGPLKATLNKNIPNLIKRINANIENFNRVNGRTIKPFTVNNIYSNRFVGSVVVNMSRLSVLSIIWLSIAPPLKEPNAQLREKALELVHYMTHLLPLESIDQNLVDYLLWRIDQVYPEAR